MVSKLLKYKKSIAGKKIAVLGLGISNLPLIEFLYDMDAVITVFDSSDEKKLSDRIEKIANYKVQFSFGDNYLNYLNQGFDYIFRSPGIRPDLPQIIEAVANGTILTSEMETFFELCPAQIFGVTGSDGKTTTTTLITEFLKEEGYKCWVGGNIGTPLLNKVKDISPDDKVILELSSFQLMTFKISPDIAVITNLSPNHLDYHLNYKEYIDSKLNIYKYQFQKHSGAKCRLILNFDDNDSKNLQKSIDEDITDLKWFARETFIEKGASYKDGSLYLDNEMIIKRSEIRLLGDHNVENYLAAIAATQDYVSAKSIQAVSKRFTGVEHRLEFVREYNGVKYYNDSIASSPSRTSAGLKAFDQKVILLAGGKDKGISYYGFGEIIVEKCKKVILIGATADLILNSINHYFESICRPNSLEIFRCTTYEEMVSLSSKISEIGDVVLLSPASTSFDMFTNFEERGIIFKELVYKL
ncbi:MAG: UDP-N-acetylmuramoyl-L-alanine--D-glutamate ligase [Bacillota bacterium]